MLETPNTYLQSLETFPEDEYMDGPIRIPTMEHLAILNTSLLYEESNALSN